MITYSFIGSDKSAGKTTALNFIYGKMVSEKSETVCLTSIGINGESVDFFDGRAKPKVKIYRGSLFLSASEGLTGFSGAFTSIYTFSPPVFTKTYTLGRALRDFEAVVEGPNTAREIAFLKRSLNRMFPDTVLLIDGSADRQFLGRPEISDAFYFSLLITDEPVQLRRAKELLLPLSFPALSDDVRKMVKGYLTDGVKSLLVSKNGGLIYEGRSIPFMDEALKSTFLKNREAVKYLYLNGAFSPGLSTFFEKSREVTFILDNFTLFQCIRSDGLNSPVPGISLLNPLFVKEIFVKNDTGKELLLPFPPGVPVTDLFKSRNIVISGSLNNGRNQTK